MNNSKKRKEIVLDSDVLEILELQAKREGRKLKNYMEHVLCEKANDFQLTEEYKLMMDKTLTDFRNGNLSFKSWKELNENISNEI